MARKEYHLKNVAFEKGTTDVWIPEHLETSSDYQMGLAFGHRGTYESLSEPFTINAAQSSDAADEEVMLYEQEGQVHFRVQV